MRLTYDELAQTIIDCVADPKLMDKTPADLVRDLVTLMRSEERDACAKAMCSSCRAGYRVHRDDNDHWFHFYAHGGKYLCASDEIRRRDIDNLSDHRTPKEGE